MHSFGVQIVRIHCIRFEVCVMEENEEVRKKERKLKERKKERKKKQQNQNICVPNFSTVRRSNGTLGLHFTYE